MKYINAKELLPEWLLHIVQDYTQGEVVYIPRKETSRSGWGQVNGTRQKYTERNTEIIHLFQKGASMEQLSEQFHLSEHSIKKIVGQRDARHMDGSSRSEKTRKVKNA